MKQKLKPTLKGAVKIYSIIGDNRDLIYDYHNAIDPNAVNVLAAMMANEPTAILDTIEISYLGTVLSQRPILTTTLISSNIVQYQAQFEMTSFSGSYDLVAMLSSGYGAFSSFIVALTKLTSEQLAIVWEIEIT